MLIDSGLKSYVIEVKECTPEMRSKIIEIYSQAYDNFFGEKHAFKGITQIVYLEKVDSVVACASMKKNRIRLIGVGSAYKGQGFGTELLSTVKTKIKPSWVTVGLAHKKVVKVVTKAGFKTAKDNYKIRELFQNNLEKNLNQMSFSCVIDKDIKSITQENQITAFTRLQGGIHNLDYAQIAFY